MVNDGSSDEQPIGRRSKVARLIDEYGLDGLGAEMEQVWTANNDERKSLRELADHFNQQLLDEALRDSGTQLLDGERENLYRLLTDEAVGESDRTRARRRLQRGGVDVDALEDDFVTYQAIRTYLKTHRQAEYNRDDRDRAVVERKNIQQLQGRTTAVTEGKLNQLKKNDHISLGDFRTLVDTHVLCEDCGERYAVDELLDRGGCDCKYP
jgi:hypothetical protein